MFFVCSRMPCIHIANVCPVVSIHVYDWALTSAVRARVGVYGGVGGCAYLHRPPLTRPRRAGAAAAPSASPAPWSGLCRVLPANQQWLASRPPPRLRTRRGARFAPKFEPEPLAPLSRESSYSFLGSLRMARSQFFWMFLLDGGFKMRCIISAVRFRLRRERTESQGLPFSSGRLSYVTMSTWRTTHSNRIMPTNAASTRVMREISSLHKVTLRTLVPAVAHFHLVAYNPRRRVSSYLLEQFADLCTCTRRQSLVYTESYHGLSPVSHVYWEMVRTQTR